MSFRALSASLRWSRLFLASMCPSKVDVSAGCCHPPKLTFHFGWHSNPSSIDFIGGPISVRTFLQWNKLSTTSGPSGAWPHAAPCL